VACLINKRVLSVTRSARINITILYVLDISDYDQLLLNLPN
jgi:hypothetical protein